MIPESLRPSVILSLYLLHLECSVFLQHTAQHNTHLLCIHMAHGLQFLLKQPQNFRLEVKIINSVK